MSAKFIIENNYIEGVDTVYTGPDNRSLRLKDNTIIKVRKVVDIYESKETILKALNLPDNTPFEMVTEIIKVLRDNPESSKSVKERVIKKSRLFEWLGVGSDLVTISTPIIAYALSTL